MKNKDTFLSVLLALPLALAGCVSTNIQPGIKPLSDAVKKVDNLLEAQNRLLPVSGLLANIAKINDGSLFQLSDRHMIIANATTNYTVTIHYTSPTFGAGLQVSNAVADVFDFEKSLLGLSPELSSLAQNHDNFGNSALQHFFSTFSLIDNLKNVTSSGEFKTNLNAHVRELLSDQLQTVAENTSTDLTLNVSLEGLTAAYLKAYVNGNFVDRWGATLSQPELTKLGSDTTVAATKVLMEALFDFVNMTPIIHDPSSTNKTPTFAVIFPALYELMSTNSDTRGVTSAENEAIKYLSGLSDEEAGRLSSLIVRSIGGAAVGVKISTGDNDTLAKIVATVCSETARRATEKLTYDIFEEFQYQTNGDSCVADHEKNQLIQPKPIRDVITTFQDSIATLLTTESGLEALLTPKAPPKQQ